MVNGGSKLKNVAKRGCQQERGCQQPHCQSIDSVVADILSQVKTNALLTDFAAIATTQDTDPSICSLQSLPTSTLVVEAVPLKDSPHPLYWHTTSHRSSTFFTTSHRSSTFFTTSHRSSTFFNSLHNLSHPGIHATQKLTTSHFVWQRKNSDILNPAYNVNEPKYRDILLPYS